MKRKAAVKSLGSVSRTSWDSSQAWPFPSTPTEPPKPPPPKGLRYIDANGVAQIYSRKRIKHAAIS